MLYTGTKTDNSVVLNARTKAWLEVAIQSLVTPSDPVQENAIYPQPHARMHY